MVKSDIIVKPDGARVLLMTTSIGGMQTSMSIKISEPTNFPNETVEEKETGMPAESGKD